jgi:cellulose synthase/poly-beta-1,6-N-acetylglucosamine synthase-like glycosyltransferase
MKSAFITQHAQRKERTCMEHSGRPIVTVVIPTRNRPALVLRAVKSALEQTLANVEVIVVVDAPARRQLILSPP